MDTPSILRHPGPATSSVLEAIDSPVSEQYAFHRIVIHLPHGAKYNPKEMSENGASGLARVIK